MSTPINDGGPAFPHATEGEYSDPQTCTHWHPYLGMSLRDYFAGQALSGMQTQWRYIELYLTSCGSGKAKDVREFMAWASYEQADAMLAARNQKGAA